MNDLHFDRAVRIIKDCAGQPPEVTARALQLAARIPVPLPDPDVENEFECHWEAPGAAVSNYYGYAIHLTPASPKPLALSPQQATEIAAALVAAANNDTRPTRKHP